MNYQEIDARDRRMIIVASPQRKEAMAKSINWSDVPSVLPLAAGATVLSRSLMWMIPGGALMSSLSYVGPVAIWAYKKFKNQSVLSLPYPVMDLMSVRNQFKFPMNHPVDGVAYGCCEAEPLLYVPLSAFHNYMYEAKMAAFHELCANLGARRCVVTYAEENGKDISAKAGATGIPCRR